MPSFQILRLPHLAFENVHQCWNPHEIYLFSTLSRVTKQLSKMMKKCEMEMRVNPFTDGQIELYLRQNNRSERWTFGNVYTNTDPRKQKTMLMVVSDVMKSFIKMVEHIHEVFKCEFRHLIIGFSPKNKTVNWKSRLPVFIKWFNAYKKVTKIPKLRVSSHFTSETHMFDEFMGTLEKDVGRLDLTLRHPCEEWKFHRKVDIFRISGSVYLSLNDLWAMDCIEIYCDTHLMNKDLNMMLKGWKAGKSNRRAKFFWLYLKEDVNWENALDGLEPVLRDARRVKRRNGFSSVHTYDIYGGIDITREDGKVATIGYFDFNTTHDELIRRRILVEYDKMVNDWKFGEVKREEGEPEELPEFNDELEEIEPTSRKSLFFSVW